MRCYAPHYWEGVWAFDLAEGVISIGCLELGDITGLDRGALRAAVDAPYPLRLNPSEG